MRRIAIALALGLYACLLPGCPTDDDDAADDDATGDDDASGDDDATGDDDTTPETFEIAADGVYPAAGSNDAYPRTPLLVRFTVAPTTSTFAVTDADTGDPVDGTVEATPDGRQLVFQPSAPLEREHAYQVGVEATGGVEEDQVSESWEITTSATGAPLDHPQSVVEMAYRLDLSGLRAVQPLLPDEIAAVLDGSLALGVVSYDPGSDALQVIASPLDGASSPDYCRASTQFPAAEFLPTEDPYLALAPTDLVLLAGGIELALADAELSGTFAADASSLDGCDLSGSLDTRGLADLLKGADPCDLLDEVAAACEPCPGDANPSCVTVRWVELGGGEIAGPLHLVASEQTENHLCGNCEDTVDNDGDGLIDGDELECYPAAWP